MRTMRTVQELANNPDAVDTLTLDECCQLLLEGRFHDGWTRELLERVLTRIVLEADYAVRYDLADKWLAVAKAHVAAGGKLYPQFTPLSDEDIERVNWAVVRKMLEAHNERRDMGTH
jgi:hypothetical protein